jgi:hypothetical protein
MEIDFQVSVGYDNGDMSEVIGQVAAPAFLLGAVAAFVLVLNERLTRVIDRSQTSNAISDVDLTRVHQIFRA